MNYYEALQRKDGKWDFTRRNDGKVWPTGYCREFLELTEDFCPNESLRQKHKDHEHKHHTCGHETKEEAQECYKEYLLDHRLRFGNMKDQQQKCRVCGEWTQGFAEVDTQLYVLCDEHRNRETFSEIMRTPEYICSSS